MAGKPEPGKVDAEPFEIELDGIVREFDVPLGAGTYEVSFDCRRDGHCVDATVALDADSVTTLDIVPRAMSELHKAFDALAEQTRAWRIGEK